MEIHISSRGVDLSPGLRRRVETKVSRAARFLPKITEARVVLERERYRHLAEVTLQAKGATLRAEGAAEDVRAAVDLAVENLAYQARRRKERIRARKPRPSRRAGATRPEAALGALDLEAGPAAEAAAEGPEVVIRRLAAKPMSVDEALEQMRARPDGLLVFTNAHSRVINVLRRRPDGQVELVQPAG